MTEMPMVAISFKDMTNHQDIRDIAEQRCIALGKEFPETTRFEITVTPDGLGLLAHARATGSHTEAATHASATELRPAVEKVLDRIERQLRRIHDKRIFTRRRDAQKGSPKRQTG